MDLPQFSKSRAFPLEERSDARFRINLARTKIAGHRALWKKFLRDKIEPRGFSPELFKKFTEAVSEQ
jgi:hypothetical protein